jgi:hypothetical protein
MRGGLARWALLLGLGSWGGGERTLGAGEISEAVVTGARVRVEWRLLRDLVPQEGSGVTVRAQTCATNNCLQVVDHLLGARLRWTN